MSKVELALENFKNIQDMIKFIDQKANVLLAIFGAVFSAFIVVQSELCFVEEPRFVNILVFILIVGVYVLGLVELTLLIFKVIVPRKANSYENTHDSLFYFGHISAMDKKEFILNFKKLNEDEELAVVLHQIYSVSRIAESKNSNYRIASYVLYIIAVLFLLIIILTRFQ